MSVKIYVLGYDNTINDIIFVSLGLSNICKKYDKDTIIRKKLNIYELECEETNGYVYGLVNKCVKIDYPDSIRSKANLTDNTIFLHKDTSDDEYDYILINNIEEGLKMNKSFERGKHVNDELEYDLINLISGNYDSDGDTIDSDLTDSEEDNNDSSSSSDETSSDLD